MFSRHEVETLKEVKVIVFRLKDEEYAVEVGQVKSIERLEPITRVPRTPGFVKGVINLRGAVVPIIDLRERLGLEGAASTENSRIIIVHFGQVDAGLIVDSATDVIDIPEKAIEPPPPMTGVIDTSYLRGIAKLENRLLILLNLNKVLEAEEVKQLAQAEGLKS